MAELEALQEVDSQVRALGARIVALTPELERYTRSVHRKLKLSFDILTFGLVTGPFKTDMQRVRQPKRDIVEAEVAADLENYKTSGAELIMGTGRFVAPKTVEVRLNAGGTDIPARR
jgi:pyruvate/2-oxoglutarate dehydrogenase complex dihydrolipoamide dehydrogenase (E3) component